jgi:hypothetical protein
MEVLLRFFKTFETAIYFVLAMLALWEIRKFAQAWEEVRTAAFSLEREIGQGKLNRASILLMLVFISIMAEFVMVSFIVPAVPGAFPLLTPTIDLLATPTITLPAGTFEAVISATAPASGTSVPLNASASPQPTVQGVGCIAGKLTLTTPKDGSQVSGEVSLIGTVDMPNFAFYRYEIARPGETVWLTIQIGDNIKHDEDLGKWNTSILAQGQYVLRLVATDNQAHTLGTCQIQVFVSSVSNP